MNPYETNTTPRQRSEQRVLGAIIVRPWLLARALADGLDDSHMAEAGHGDIVRGMLLISEHTATDDWSSEAMVMALERMTDAASLGGAPIADGLRALKAIAEQDLGPGRREDVRALAMLLDDIDTLRGVEQRHAARGQYIDEVNRVARMLIAEWERVEKRPVNASYVATFADMARVVVADRVPQKDRDIKPDDLPMLATPDAVIEDGKIVGREHATVDLDDLERKARAASPGEWRWGRPAEGDPERFEHTRALFAPNRRAASFPVIVLDASSLYLALADDCEHIAANSPPVTLALITRIRELEGDLRDAAETVCEHGLHASCDAYTATLKKGAVLP